MNTNHTPQDPLDAAEAALREIPPHVVPSTATLNRIATLAVNAEAESLSMTSATSAGRNWRKIVGLLLTSAALVAAFYGILHTPQSTFAFEDVVAAVRNANTVSYTTVLTPRNGRTSQVKNYYKGRLARTVHADGSYMVMDMAGSKMLSVHPATKTATLTHLGSKPPADLPAMGDTIITWLATAETTGKAVGEKTIDGVRTVGFEAAFGATTMTIWGDPKTKLPVQIEATIGSPSEPIQTVMREFVFNAPLEDALFSTDVPAGFQVKETKQPTIDVAALVKLPPEEHVVRILKFYAKLNDGAFPERIDGPELVAKLTSSAGAKVEDPEFTKEFTTLAGSMGATWLFRQTLNKFGYVGTAHLNDADSIVFWYLPKDAQKYRVVFADLTIGDVTEEKLPKTPLK